MKKMLVLSAVAASVAGMLPVSASAADILARVISSTPVVQQIAVPRQVCNNQAVVTEAPKSGAGALMGAVAGGAAGNAIGNGNGRALATVIGLMGGAILGNNIEGSGSQVRNVQQCVTQTVYENRASHYNVVYEYQGTQYNVQMPNDPGQYVRLQVTPVGAINAPPQQGFAPQPQPYTYQPPPQQFQPPQSFQQPQTYLQPNPSQPVYIQQSTTYLQPAPVYIAPAYYPRPHHSPYHVAPAGVSLNLGYSRAYGHPWR